MTPHNESNIGNDNMGFTLLGSVENVREKSNLTKITEDKDRASTYAEVVSGTSKSQQTNSKTNT